MGWGAAIQAVNYMSGRAGGRAQLDYRPLASWPAGEGRGRGVGGGDGRRRQREVGGEAAWGVGWGGVCVWGGEQLY